MNDLPLLNAKQTELPAKGCHSCMHCSIGPGMGGEIYPQCRAEPPKLVAIHAIQMGIQGPQLAPQVLTMYPRIDLADTGCGSHTVKLAVMN